MTADCFEVSGSAELVCSLCDSASADDAVVV